MGTIDASALSRQVLENVKAQVRQQRIELGTELLPRLEEVTSLLTEASVARFAGAPSPELEAILQARLATLQAAATLQVAEVVREATRQALLGALHGAFSLAIGAVVP